MTEHRYRVKYAADKLPGDGMTKAEMQADPKLEGFGGTDKFLLFSIVEPKSGGKSISFYSCDSTGGELPEEETFEAAMLVMRSLAVKGRLGHEKEAFCWAIWNTYLKEMRGLPEQTLTTARMIDAQNLEKRG